MQESKLVGCGIIAEYNPFHNGHVYQLQQARQKSGDAVLVVVMSGNFVQRGELALVDKWTRAQMALAGGADLVIELPFQVASQPADRFSDGAVAILNDLQCQYLAFGTETSHLDYAKLGDAMLQLPQRHDFFVDYKKTYATQLNELLQAELGITLDQPNLLLAASYAKSVAALAHTLTLLPIQRIGVTHDAQETAAQFTSASWLRKQLTTVTNWSAAAPFLPKTSLRLLSQWPTEFLTWSRVFELLKYRITSMTLTELAGIYQVTEGLEHRIKHVIRKCTSFEALLTAVKTKRYTFARLQRVFLYILLNVTDALMLESQLFIHPLGFNYRGQRYLHQVKKQLTLPLVTRLDRQNTKPGAIFYLQNRVDLLIEQLTGQTQNFGRQPINYAIGG
ncbi:nucleotidyltransferase [Agrilactobacillus yilanensis]|uniref:tRNA(Met) cytidine acetate ligase n=1 Tax=Agrilactobacillus yilanensis TaxID=2485997 RepID=A0ABW4J9W8_9LACO|nr:nucleotidyltransferase [Agrilactobacillus yilanensis]